MPVEYFASICLVFEVGLVNNVFKRFMLWRMSEKIAFAGLFFLRGVSTLIMWEMLDECLLLYNTSYVLDNIFFSRKACYSLRSFQISISTLLDGISNRRELPSVKICTAAEIKRTENEWDVEESVIAHSYYQGCTTIQVSAFKKLLF